MIYDLINSSSSFGLLGGSHVVLDVVLVGGSYLADDVVPIGGALGVEVIIFLQIKVIFQMVLSHAD
jgi:hypothetical protein